MDAFMDTFNAATSAHTYYYNDMHRQECRHYLSHGVELKLSYRCQTLQQSQKK